MRLVENETRLTMNKRRNFVNYADMTLSDGTILHLTPSDFRISGQSFTDDWIDGEAFQIGTAIGKTATLLLDNTDGREENTFELQTSEPADWSTNYNDYYTYSGGFYYPIREEEAPTWIADTYYTLTNTITYPHGKFSEYDFYMAYFVLYVCLPEAYHYEGELRDQIIRIGTFTITTPTAHGSTIEITGVDNMYMFDKSFDDCDLDFSTNPTLLTVLNKCCEDCGVAIGYGSFNNQNLTVNKKPEGVTYRQVVSYIAQIAGCNAKISDTGALILRWYDTSVFTDNWLDGGIFDDGTPKYVTGDDADGGSFNPWNTGYVIDGGDFATPLDYHNLISTNGTSVSTDDIQFTGVLVQNEDTSAHYPDVEGWDNYAMVISDNPFVAGYEDTIALYIYSQLEDLKFRPFTTSSIQDPTIEAGDCALVYDVKGNMYKTIITNVTFKTGGMTELSCNAEPPARQNSRYVNPAAQAVAKAEKKMDDYNAQVAHFNEIASQALGYFKTEEIDTDTGATITYFHNNPSLISSQNIIKIASGIIAISDDGGESWNQGFDASTGTMLLNLIYVHGLTADWIRTGQLTVGGVDNIDGVIHVVNEKSFGTDTWRGTGHEGSGWWSYKQLDYSSLTTPGSYKLTKVTISNISSPGDFVDFYYKIEVSTDGGSTWPAIKIEPLVSGENIINYVMSITSTNDAMYRISIGKNNVLATDPTFTYTVYTTHVNTKIDKDGIDTSNINIKGGGININNNFIVTPNGSMTAKNGSFSGSLNAADGTFTGTLQAVRGTLSDGTGTLSLSDGSLVMSQNTLDGAGLFAYGSSNYSCWGATNSAALANGAYRQVPTWDVILAGYNASDERLKEKIEDIDVEFVKNLILGIKPKQFVFKDIPDELQFGVIAQDVKEIEEKSKILQKNRLFYEQKNGTYAVEYRQFIAPLIRMTQIQQEEINDLKKRIEALETLVNINK